IAVIVCIYVARKGVARPLRVLLARRAHRFLASFSGKLNADLFSALGATYFLPAVFVDFLPDVVAFFQLIHSSPWRAGSATIARSSSASAHSSSASPDRRCVGWCGTLCSGLRATVAGTWGHTNIVK